MEIRRVKNNNHVSLNTSCLRDTNLSLKAKGLHSLVMSLPDTWDFSINGICTITKESKDAIKSAIKELRESSYCIMQKLTNEKGQIAKFEYVFLEEPMTANPLAENPLVENPTQSNVYNNKLLYTIDINNNNKDLILKKEISKERNEDDELFNKKSEQILSRGDIKWFIEYWNENLPSQQIRTFTAKRKQKLLVRANEMKENGAGDILRQLTEIVNEIRQSKFLQGDNKTGFKATIDWVLDNSNNYVKILEGNYRDAKEQPAYKSTTTSGCDSQDKLRENIARRLLGVNNGMGETSL